MRDESYTLAQEKQVRTVCKLTAPQHLSVYTPPNLPSNLSTGRLRLGEGLRLEVGLGALILSRWDSAQSYRGSWEELRG